MSLYHRGLSLIHVGDLQPPKDSNPMVTASIVGAGILVIFLAIPAIRRSRIPQARASYSTGRRGMGPDTRDIEARIASRGHDPYLYGLSDRRR